MDEQTRVMYRDAFTRKPPPADPGGGTSP
jgi:hypothetical protein